MLRYIKRGQVTAEFQSYKPEVEEQMGFQHTGIDEVKGGEWFADNAGVAYKVWDNRYPDWQAVHQICMDSKGHYFEVINLGHANDIYVLEGEFVNVGEPLGTEGNSGLVFSSGRKVTKKERLEGSKAGTHNHRGIRPVTRVEKVSRGEHYLRKRDGSPYQDNDGFYYQIVFKDRAKGWINPRAFEVTDPIVRLEILRENARFTNRRMVPIYTTIIGFVKAFI